MEVNLNDVSGIIYPQLRSVDKVSCIEILHLLRFTQTSKQGFLRRLVMNGKTKEERKIVKA